MSEKSFATWAIVEALGHNTFAGYVTEASIAGAQMVRIDVPESAAGPAFTTFIGAGSIYRLTPVDEATARKAARYFRKAPIDRWKLEEPRRPERPALSVGGDDDGAQIGF